MYTPEEQQIKICLLKYDLEELEYNLVDQHTKIPSLEAENNQIYNEAMRMLREVRLWNTEIEKLMQNRVRLIAKREQQKQQCGETLQDLATAHADREHLMKSLNFEKADTLLQIRKYKDSLQEMAERYRENRAYYDEEKVKKEIENVNKTIDQIQFEFTNKQNLVVGLKIEEEGILPEVPKNLPEICGIPELVEKFKSLTDEFEEVSAKLKTLF